MRFRLPSRADLAELAKLAVPVTVVQVAMMALGVEDSMIVGRHSAAGLAAVSIGGVYFFTLISLGLGLISGLEPLMSQAFGAGDREAMTRAFQRGLAITIAFGTVSGLTFFGAAPALRAIGQPESIVQYAGPYLLVQAPSTYAFLLFALLRSWLQVSGTMRPIMIAIVVGNALNIVLSIGLVFGRWGLPAMGPVGSGLATAIARWTMTLVLAAFAWPQLRGMLVWRRESLARGPMGRVLRLGLPVGLQILFEFGVFAVVGLVMGHLGPVTAAAHQVAINIASLTYMVPLGIGTAGSVMVGRAIGAGRPDDARRVAVTTVVCGVGFMACTAVAFTLVPAWLARTYTNDAATIALAATLIPIAGVFQVFDGLQVVSIGLLRGTGDTRTPMIVNLVGYWCVGLPLALWLGRGLGYGPAGLWWGLVAGLVAVALIVATRLRVRMRGPLERLHVEGDHVAEYEHGV